MAIDHINLGGIDLNLLVALDALLAERSVTRAAARVGLGQSAMSHALGRLRVLFGDELLTRGADGMRATPRALALADPVRLALSQVQALVSPGVAFDPATAERVFRIALPDSVEVLLGPALLAHLRATAPRVRLRLYSSDTLVLLDELDADRIDLAVGFGIPAGGQTHHRWRPFLRTRYLCIFNAALVGVAAPISLADYVRLPHVLTSLRPGEHGVVDDALAPLGLARTVVLTTPRFLAVPFLVAGAPVVATMHARLAQMFARQLGLSLSPPPVTLPEVTLSLLWHASYEADPGHRWLRQTIAEVMNRADGEEGWALPKPAKGLEALGTP